MLDRLRSIVGPDGVRVDEEAVRWAARGAVPKAVVSPGTAEQAAELLALASAEGWAVEPAGAGTWLDAGRTPKRVDLVVSTARLDGVVAYEPADLVASVGAGTPLDALRALLAPHGQWLPLDPPGDPAATLGATVATASAGPLREGHGTPRDHVLGLQLVTGDGRILDLGGQVVKNVAGYDLVKLTIGSWGTLGLVTRVNVRLRPAPERDATLGVSAAEPAPLLELAARVRERIEPAALELVTPAPRQNPPGAGWLLLVRLQGRAEAVADAEAGIRDLCTAAGLEAEAEEGDPWEPLRHLEGGASVRLADAPSRLADTLRLAQRLPGAGTTWHVLAHVGTGIVRVAGRNPAPALDLDGWEAVLAEARAELAGRRGTVTLAGWSEALQERIEPFGDPGPALRLMRALKQEFDPAGVMAPGRFVV